VSRRKRISKGRKCSPSGKCFGDDSARSVGGSVSKPVHRVWSKMVVRNRVSEAPACVFLMHGVILFGKLAPAMNV